MFLKFLSSSLHEPETRQWETFREGKRETQSEEHFHISAETYWH
jgi:hypothetical protein